MNGPGGVKIPAQTQALEGLSKQASDLIGADFSIAVDGKTVKASGEVKNIQTPWEEYDKTNNTGHFVPLTLPAESKGKEVTISGRKGGDRTVTAGDDLLLVQRIENLNGSTMPVKMDGKDLMTVDFGGVIPTGEDAIDYAKTDFGGYGKKSDYVEGISIQWDGVKGTVFGTIKKHEKIGTKNVKAGHHYPLSLCVYYDGIEKDVTVSKKTTVKDKDIICDLSSARTITVEYNGKTVLALDFTRAVFE